MQIAQQTPFSIRLNKLANRLQSVESLNNQFPKVHGRMTKNEIQWSIVNIISSIVMGLLTAYVYKQAQKNLAIALGVVTGVQLLNIGNSKEIEFETYKSEQESKKAHSLFCGIEEEFKQMHRHASDFIIDHANGTDEEKNMKDLKQANSTVNRLLDTYLHKDKGSDKLSPEQKAYRAQMSACFKDAIRIANLNEHLINRLHSAPLKEEINKIIPIAQTLVYGRPLRKEHGEIENARNITYVDVTKDYGSDPKFTARRWAF